MHSDDIGCFKSPNVSFISSYISSHLIVQCHTANWRCVWCVRFRDWNCIFLNFTIFLLFRRFSLFFLSFTAPVRKEYEYHVEAEWVCSFTHIFPFFDKQKGNTKRLVFTSSRISLMFSYFSTRTISGFFTILILYLNKFKALHLIWSRNK